MMRGLMSVTLFNRKATGAYYTPGLLIELMLDQVLRGGGAGPREILDPACGPGDFLLAAQRRVPDASLFGVDVDAAVLGECRSALAGALNADPDRSDSHFACTDALLDPPAFFGAQSFDLVLGNPPFVNAIEKDLTPHTKGLLREKFPEVKGAADLAAYFLALAIRLVRPGGRIALVLPRPLLNSPTVARLRANLPAYLRPNLIYAPERNDFFPGAKIFTVCLILGPEDRCLLSTDPNPATARFFSSPPPATDNWWQHLSKERHEGIEALRHEGEILDQRVAGIESREPSPASSSADLRLSSIFSLQASLTTADAYHLVPHLIDSEEGPGQKLLTTGLIDPGISHWGKAPCRFLNQTFRRPRVNPEARLTPSLARRRAQSRRPKLLVAGLSQVFEAYLDSAGEYLGSVSTFSIFHPADDLGALERLGDHLHSEEMTRHLVSTLAANALRGKYITIKKSLLLELPLF